MWKAIRSRSKRQGETFEGNEKTNVAIQRRERGFFGGDGGTVLSVVESVRQLLSHKLWGHKWIRSDA